ncbi:hypothetical protein [Chromobacterium violaceum]|uniref:Uncharacterized protein n=1 Tax=Chromobacterium violaceum TaxID=536 RepID=A0A202B579_CHRVL|nr:hypothetical protein [Chromobacterium violaceum]OVE46723.1 hypothetical protein CBW21_17665 [Chromobacterium violaceum]
MQTLTQLADAARAVIAADRAGELTDELISALELALNAPATEQSDEAVAIVDEGDDGMWADILPDRNVRCGQLLYTRPQPAPAVPDIDAVMRAVDEYAASTACARLESLYGTSQSYVEECYRHRDEARAKLYALLAAAPQPAQRPAPAEPACHIAEVSDEEVAIACTPAQRLLLREGMQLYAAPQPAQQLPSVIEEIAQQWDGCIYDSPSGDIDIGWAIRAAGLRLMREQPAEGGE